MYIILFENWTRVVYLCDEGQVELSSIINPPIAFHNRDRSIVRSLD